MIAETIPSLLSAALYAALIVVIGSLGVYWLVLPRCGLVATEGTPVARRAATSAMLASVAVLLIVPMRVLTQLTQLLEPGEPWREAFNAIVFSTQSGKAAQLQIVWAMAAFFAFSVARTGRPRGWRVATIAVIMLAITPGLGGHPATAPRPILAMTVATMHVLGAGLWIGTLYHLWHASNVFSMATIERMVRAFHGVAISAVGLLVITGAYASLTTLQHLSDLVRTPWGVLLTLKLLAVMAVLTLGGWHLRTAGLQLARGRNASVRSTIGLELVFALVVIVLTGFLAGTGPPE